MKNKYVKMFWKIAIFCLSTLGQAFAFDHSHTRWNLVLQKYVALHAGQSRVRYQDIKSSPQDLQSYLIELEKVKQSEFDAFDQKEKLSFLINAYNAFTIKLIIDHYPVSSIKNIGTWPLSDAWKLKFFTLLEQKRNLNWIEHDVLRKKFNEPRIHFALICASRGCPPLLTEAFTSMNLQENLEKGKSLFLKDSSKNNWDPNNRTLSVSSIFKWYGGDFGSKNQMIEFILNGMGIKTEAKSVSLAYLSYDWSLNGN